MAKLVVNNREVVGKKVKNLRRDGMVPAVLFGPGHASENVSVNEKEFREVFAEAGFSHLIDAEMDGRKQKVIIKEVQRNPVKGDFEHVGLYVIDQKREINAEIPIVLTGVAPVVDQNIGFIVSPVDTVAIKCLPKDLPAEITVSIENLAEIGDSITFGDITLPEGVEFDSQVDLTTAIVLAVGAQKEEEEEASAEGEEATEESESTAEAGEASEEE